MKNFFKIDYISALILLIVQYNIVTATAMDNIANSVGRFSVRFVNEMNKGTSIVASPLSCEILLALLTLGSTDPAHSELTNAIGIASDDEIRKSFKFVASSIKSVKGITLNVANKIYIKDGDYALNGNFSKDAVNVFDAALEEVNFSNGAAAAQTINNWVEQKTEHKIKDILSPEVINEDTRLVLVNAIYFKGQWKYRFDKEATVKKNFYFAEKKWIKVPMMWQEASFKYRDDKALRAQLLEMPYNGEDTSMLIILPYEIEGLNAVIQKLADGHDLVATFKRMFYSEVSVSIPKFKIETKIDLVHVIKKLGMPSIFNFPSGLTKLLDNKEPLSVSEAIQKAFIEVNEKGTEAAAVSTVEVQQMTLDRSMPIEIEIKYFNANRPFLYYINDRSGIPLFQGVYYGKE